MTKKRRQPIHPWEKGEISLEDFCLLDDKLYEEQKLLAQLSASMMNVVKENQMSGEKTIALVVGLDPDLLDQVRKIAQDFGKIIADWARVTLAELSYIIEEVRALIGLKQLRSEPQF